MDVNDVRFNFIENVSKSVRGRLIALPIKFREGEYRGNRKPKYVQALVLIARGNRVRRCDRNLNPQPQLVHREAAHINLSPTRRIGKK